MLHVFMNTIRYMCRHKDMSVVSTRCVLIFCFIFCACSVIPYPCRGAPHDKLKVKVRGPSRDLSHVVNTDSTRMWRHTLMVDHGGYQGSFDRDEYEFMIVQLEFKAQVELSGGGMSKTA
jgi:hypothetical protein